MKNENDPAVEPENDPAVEPETEEVPGGLTRDALQAICDSQTAQIEELKKELETERKSHREDIINIMRGTENARTKEQQQLEEMINRINKNRRRV